MTLGELLASMGPGNPAGMPQMAPPMGIPWEQPQPQVPVAPPPQQMMTRGANQAPEYQAPSPPRAPGQITTDKNNVIGRTGEAIGGIEAQFMNWLNDSRNRWAEGDRNAYEDQRGVENTTKPATPGAEEKAYGFDPLADVGRPSVQPTARAATPSASTAPNLTSYDEYGNPVPVQQQGNVPLDLGQLLYSDSNIPLPERRGQTPAPTPSPTLSGAQRSVSGPSQASAAPANRGTPAAAAPSGSRASKAPPPFTNAPNTDDPFPQSSPLFDPTTQKFLLQTGLNLMVPQWGGPLANIGAAAGGGAEAVDRAQQTQQTNRLVEEKINVEKARVAKMGLGKKASESSASKRLKEKTPAQQLASTLSPEGALYFNQRMKQLNKLAAPDEDGNVPDASNTFDQIMNETKRVDHRARMGRGQLKSEEIPDADLNKAAGDPNLEAKVLNWVAMDPVQRQLVQTRLQNAKAKSVGGTSAKPNG